MPTLDQVKRDLAFSDAGPPDEQQSETVHVDKRAVNRGLRRKLVVEKIAEKIDRLCRFKRRPKHGNIVVGGKLHELLIDRIVARDKNARDCELEQRIECLDSLLKRHAVEVANFGVAEHLNAIVREEGDVPCERQTRPMDTFIPNRIIVTDVCQRHQLKANLVCLVEEANRNTVFANLFSGFKFHRQCTDGN